MWDNSIVFALYMCYRMRRAMRRRERKGQARIRTPQRHHLVVLSRSATQRFGLPLARTSLRYRLVVWLCSAASLRGRRYATCRFGCRCSTGLVPFPSCHAGCPCTASYSDSVFYTPWLKLLHDLIFHRTPRSSVLLSPEFALFESVGSVLPFCSLHISLHCITLVVPTTVGGSLSIYTSCSMPGNTKT
jgi:hypothetical protein